MESGNAVSNGDCPGYGVAHAASGKATVAVIHLPDNKSETQLISGDACQKSTTVGPSSCLEIKLYRARFLVLFLFCLYSMSNAFQWIEYAIITNIISRYYEVENQSVNWTSVIYMVTYIPLIFPATWLLDRKGLRFVVLLGSFGTCLGSWIKCTSIMPDRFYVTMVGQTVVAISQIFILGIPPRLAAVWFSADGVSTACAVGVFGNQVGIALGFLVPPLLVPDSTDKAEIASGLRILFYTIAGITSVLFAIIVIAFKDKPPHPPSRAQAAILAATNEENYCQSMAKLAKNCNFVILLITYGINVGVFYALSTLLNQVVLHHFEGKGEEAGWMGLTIVISGMFGSVFCGSVLDKTHKFKETTLGVYILSLACMLCYTFLLKLGYLWLVFLVAGLLGFFMTGYLPVGFEFGAEITYPESEGTSAGLLNAFAQIFGITFTLTASSLLDTYGDLTANLALTGALVVGTIMTVFIHADLKRQKASQEMSPVLLVNQQCSPLLQDPPC